VSNLVGTLPEIIVSAFIGVLIWLFVKPTSGSELKRTSSPASSMSQTSRSQPVDLSSASRRRQLYPRA